jgi:hypothetical protein
MSERLKHEGRLMEQERAERECRLCLEGLRDSIRDILDPVEPVQDLKMDVALAQMSEMARRWADHKEILQKIALIKKILGV